MAKECSNTSCNKSSCEGCGQKQPQSLMAEPNVFSDVKHVIGVVSGKGGVGKSFVTGSLANLMASKGYKVGIMDADITGPSIPKMYGIKGNAQGSDNGIYPMPTANGIEVMSVNLLLPDEETPVLWRGPVLANMVNLAIRLSVALIFAPRFGIAFVWLAVPAGWLANFLISYMALRRSWPTDNVVPSR